ncbi:MAG: hypothetical protein M1819_000442 [Sarea resinae]|nr:MAG: hypothetical protein M1819_000442 [Sarea resinae]
MATTVPQNPTSQTVAALLPRLHDADSDFRYMSLNDLYTVLMNGHPGFLMNDYNTCARTVDGLLRTLDDQNGEVQNLAIKCLTPLVLRVPSSILAPLIEKLSNLTTHNAVDSSIPATALQTVVANLPKPVPGAKQGKPTLDAYAAISKVLIPRLVGYVVHAPGSRPDLPPGMLEHHTDKGVDSSAIDILTEVARSFGPMLHESEVRALQKVVLQVLESERSGSVVKKKAVVAISVLAVYFSDDLLSSFVSQLIESFRNPHLTPVKRRLLINIVGSMARSIPHRFGPYLKTLAPFVLSALSEQELEDQLEDLSEDEERDPQVDDVREAALVALDGLLASCANGMRAYTEDSIDAALRFLKYDPNIANDDDEDMDGEDFDVAGELGEDDDFEEEGGFSDDDDLSWKVRRCAAKVLYTLISTRGSGDLLDDGTLYERVAPVLLDRFKEREENVRLEVLATMGLLVRKTGEGSSLSTTSAIEEGYMMGPPISRKRRRGGSDASMFDTQSAISISTGITTPAMPPAPASGPRASLTELIPTFVRAVSKLLSGGSIPTKQASITLLKDLISVQHGGLSDYLDQLMAPLVEALRTPSSLTGGTTTSVTGGAASTGSTLRIEALSLVKALAETHTSSVLKPYLGSLVPPVVSSVEDKFSKVSAEALNTLEALVKVLTPPRSAVLGQEYQPQLMQLYDIMLLQITANDADLEVRQRAIHALGVLLARTSGPEGSKLVSASKRSAALDALYERLRNETTRLAAVRAIDAVAAMATDEAEFSSSWVQGVCLELGSQLRKADRSLRGASLAALKNLVMSRAGQTNLDDGTVEGLNSVLLPLLTTNDLHLLGPALVVLSSLTQRNARLVVTPDMNSALCSIVLAPLSGAVLDAFLGLVKTIGEQKVGRPLMQGILKDVGVTGDPAVVGKAVGTLLVYGGPSVGVKVDDFINELQTAQDDQRKCLALAVLGEAGLRLGPSSPLTPELFMAHFKSKSDQVPLAAAVALGRSSAGDLARYLPVLLPAISNRGDYQYLLIHSIKEILQQAGETHTDISQYSQQIWQILLETAHTDDNKAVSAECIGRLTVFDPKTYLPVLQQHLKDESPAVRGMASQAIRYTFTDSEESYDEVLKPNLIGMLNTMLNDTDLENRRLALTSLNSAARNKPSLILPHLGQLLPCVMKETVVNPELVHEVQMGPFRHKVDDGLEVRKSAYETLYALMETAFSRINIVDFYDRVMAGLDDEHDIRVLCNLMLAKLVTLDREETLRRLDAIAERFRVILSFKPKDNAVKQELEKAAEASRGALKVTLQLQKAFDRGNPSHTWVTYSEWVRKDFASQLRSIEEESREKV